MKKVTALILVILVLFQVNFPLKVFGADGTKKEKIYDKLKAELRLLPKDLTIEEAVDNGFFVIVQSQLKSNPKLMEKFYINTSSDMPSEIKTLMYNVEGEPIITILKYDGDSFYGVEDSARASYGSKDFREFNYKYLKKFKESRLVYFCLFNTDDITFEEYKKSIKEENLSEKMKGRLLVSYDLTSYFIDSFSVVE